MKKSILTVLACAFATLAMAQAKPVLAIEGGKVQGVSTDIEGVTVYRGIPYAAAPIGDLRWKAPQPDVADECNRGIEALCTYLQVKGKQEDIPKVLEFLQPKASYDGAPSNDEVERIKKKFESEE